MSVGYYIKVSFHCALNWARNSPILQYNFMNCHWKILLWGQDNEKYIEGNARWCHINLRAILKRLKIIITAKWSQGIRFLAQRGLFQKGKGHHHFKIHKMRATIHPLKNELADRRGKEQTQWPNNNLAAGGRPKPSYAICPIFGYFVKYPPAPLCLSYKGVVESTYSDFLSLALRVWPAIF